MFAFERFFYSLTELLVNFALVASQPFPPTPFIPTLLNQEWHKSRKYALLFFCPG